MDTLYRILYVLGLSATVLILSDIRAILIRIAVALEKKTPST